MLPHYRKDGIALERVEMRFTKMLPELEEISYAARLIDWACLFPVEQRGLRDDLIEVCKIMKSIDMVFNHNISPLVGISKTREHSFKMSFKGDLGDFVSRESG